MVDVLILTDAGEGIGWGHKMRMKVLAEALQQQGFTVHWKVYEIGQPIETDWLSTEAQWLSAHVCVVDSYRPQQDFFERLRSHYEFVVVLDDFARLNYAADLVVNTGCSFQPEMYAEMQAEVVGGASFVLLRSAFVQAAQTKHSSVRAQIKRIFCTVGGSDYRNLLPQLIPFFVHKFPDIELDVVAACPHYAQHLRQQFSQPTIHIHSQLTGEAMAQLMRQADVAVTGAGQIVHELAALGLPLVPLIIDEDQQPNIRFLQRQALIFDAIMWSDPQWEIKLEQALSKLSEGAVRQSLRYQLQQLVDGQGAERLAEMMMQKYARKRYHRLLHIDYNGMTANHLADLIHEDQLEILQWRNHPRVKSQMRNTASISQADHEHFLQMLPQKRNAFYWRVESNEQKLGVIYLTQIQAEEAELGIYKNPFLAQKAGTALMDFLEYIARDHLRLFALTLEVRADNQPALHLYEQRGFKIVQQNADFILMKKQWNGT